MEAERKQSGARKGTRGLVLMQFFHKRTTDKTCILEHGTFCTAVGWLIQRRLTECLWALWRGGRMREDGMDVGEKNNMAQVTR